MSVPACTDLTAKVIRDEMDKQVTDDEIRKELKDLHDRAVRVWDVLEKRSKNSVGFRMRYKMAKRAWKITDMTWPLLRDGLKEYDAQ
jgi:hypothetical protein